MSLDACAELLARGDPDRYRAALAAPVAARPPLLVLGAFNLELARAPWVTKEPLIAEMRLQWWRDVVAEPAPRAHEVAGPLHDLIRTHGLPVPVLDAMAAARRWEVWTEPFESAAAFASYLDDTAGGLTWLSALALGAGPGDEAAFRAHGRAAGLARFLQAVPALAARGRHPLVDDTDAALRDLAAEGLAQLDFARKARLARPLRPALLAGWQAEALLRQVVADPDIVTRGGLALSEFGARGRLLWQATTGRF